MIYEQDIYQHSGFNLYLNFIKIINIHIGFFKNILNLIQYIVRIELNNGTICDVDC